MLSTLQMAAYASTFAIAAAIPGPGMTTVMARSVGGHAGIGFAVLLGIIAGDLTYLTFAVFGLALVAHSFKQIYTVIQLFAAFYLAYLAWQFWRASKSQLHFDKVLQGNRWGEATLSGLLVTLSNPKAIAFYLALLPLAVNLDQVDWQSWAFNLVPTTVAVLLLVGAVYIFAAFSMKKLLSSTAGQTWMYRGAAMIMFLVAVSMLGRFVI